MANPATAALEAVFATLTNVRDKVQTSERSSCK